MKSQLFNKFRNTYLLLKNRSSIINAVSYYPECKRKSTKEVLKDQLYFVWKYGIYEKFYYAYGFDV